MVAIRTQKRSAADNSNPLSQSVILQLVLSYVPGQWLILAAVSSLWKSVYSELDAQDMQTAGPYNKKAFTCVPQMTLFSSVFASPALVKYAHESNLDNSKASYRYAAGRQGSAATLVAARDLGMPFTINTMRAAAAGNQLNVVQYAHQQHEVAVSVSWSICSSKT